MGRGASPLPDCCRPRRGRPARAAFRGRRAGGEEELRRDRRRRPPLLGTDDARSLAPVAEGILVVVSAGSMASPVNEAILAVESFKAPMLGIVANRLRESRNLYY